jgi:heme exporter protein C
VYTPIVITLLVTGCWVGLLFLVYWGGEFSMKRPWLPWLLGAVGLALLAPADYYGLFVTPPEQYMGDVYRIFYAHVPADWMAFMALSLNLVFSVAYLVRKSWRFDAISESSAEVGLLFGVIGVATGSIWARPTWGTWWAWGDPRLISSAIMLVAYAGYLALRRFVDDPERRAVWSAVVAIVAAVDLPIIWYSVKWWASIHQPQTSPETLPDASMRWALRWHGFAYLFVLLFFVLARYRVARSHNEGELALPPENAAPGVAA